MSCVFQMHPTQDEMIGERTKGEWKETGANWMEGDTGKLKGEKKRMKVEKRGMKGEKMRGENLTGENLRGENLKGVKMNAGKWLGLALCVLAGAVLTPSTAYAGPRKVNVQLTDHGFSPSNILAVLDQPIEIHVVNTGHRDHQFSIPYYRIYSRDLSPGATTDIAFSPWTAGHFDVMSDPSGNNHAEFRGQFIVAGNSS